MQLKNKSGITMIVLVITIVIILILTSAIVASIMISTQNVDLSTFANNISQIQNSIRSMYLLENHLPIINNAPKITRENILNLVPNEKRGALNTELEKNGETDKTYFYQIDLDKAGVDKTRIGSGKNGSDDIYVVSMNSLKVYFLKGVKYKEKFHFSLDTDIVNAVNLPDYTQDESTITMSTFDAVTIMKQSHASSSSLGIKIIANMDYRESLKLSYPGISEKNLLLKEGQTVIEVNTLSDFNSYLESELTQNEMQVFQNLKDENRYLMIIKYDNHGRKVGSHKIELENYDNQAPTVTLEAIQKYDSFNMLSGTAKDNHQVAQVRYVFLNTLSQTNNIHVDEAYMKNHANMISLSDDGKFSIKVPKDVITMKVAVTDKAGNMTIKDVTI